jgi:hypothetical protein
MESSTKLFNEIKGIYAAKAAADLASFGKILDRLLGTVGWALWRRTWLALCNVHAIVRLLRVFSLSAATSYVHVVCWRLCLSFLRLLILLVCVRVSRVRARAPTRHRSQRLMESLLRWSA